MRVSKHMWTFLIGKVEYDPGSLLETKFNGTASQLFLLFFSHLGGNLGGGVGVPSSSRKPGPLPDSSREILKLHMNFEVREIPERDLT